MRSTKREYLGMVCNLYMVILLAVLPLYTGGTYYGIGDSKYLLFRNVSLLCLGIWAVFAVVAGVDDLVSRVRCVMQAGQAQAAQYDQKARGINWSVVDIFVLAYGICVLLSAICSPYESAWSGYRDWHMGAVSQLMFVGIYFLVSRYYDRNAFPIYVGELAFFLIVGIGFLNRLGMDPLGLFSAFSESDWEYSHMLSAIGNINWLCGYCSVVLAFPITGYLYSKRKWKSALLYTVSVAGLTLLFIQGSDSGMVLTAVAIGICLLAGWKKPDFFRKGLWLLAGTAIGIFVMGQLITALGTQSATPVDGDVYDKMLWNGWWVLAGLAVCISLGHARLFGDSYDRRSNKKSKRTLLVSALMLVAVFGVVLAVVVNRGNQVPENWGSGRGALWKLAWEGFGQADFGGKLIGAGPDCYAEYLTSIGKPPVITGEDHWANAIFANAHNEWLNHLVNIGILGTLCYLGIFASALKRYRGMMLAMLVLGMYGIHSLVSFQQVLNTPLFFLVLGICENRYRHEVHRNETV